MKYDCRRSGVDQIRRRTKVLFTGAKIQSQLLIVIVITSVITLVYFKKIKVNTGEQQHMHDVHIEMNDILNP